jgi:tripartite-type tricarboxylate transporter receptor subunit TctC
MVRIGATPTIGPREVTGTVPANQGGSMGPKMRALALIGCIAWPAVGATPAAAQNADQFYRGKTVTMIVGTGPSPGPVTSYPHALARVVGKYIPGNPTVIVSNMPGAGGIKASNYIYDIAPQDGTVWGFITRGFVLAPLLKPNVAVFDPRKFNWIGSPTRSTSVGEVWTAATRVRTIQDAMTQEVIVGATSPTQDTGVFPAMLNRFVGTKFKIVSGYKSSGDVDLAIEKGEVQGKMGVTWSSLKGGPQANWVKDKIVTIVVQFGLKPDPDVPADVPVALELAKTPEDRQAIEVLGAPTEMGYPSFMGPGVPKDRVAMIRSAFIKALNDPEFTSVAETQGLEVNPISGAEIEKVVQRLYSLPPSAVSRAAEVVP